jgi:hypothetical protein
MLSKNLFIDYINPLLEIRKSEDKGRGVFATADIAKGTLISAERALATHITSS